MPTGATSLAVMPAWASASRAVASWCARSPAGRAPPSRGGVDLGQFELRLGDDVAQFVETMLRELEVPWSSASRQVMGQSGERISR